MDKSPFQKLSPELRNNIWQFAVTELHGRVYISFDESVQQPSITRTCNQIRGESLLMFYSENDFCSYNDDDRGTSFNTAFEKGIEAAAAWIKQTPASHRSVARLSIPIMSYLLRPIYVGRILSEFWSRLSSAVHEGDSNSPWHEHLRIHLKVCEVTRYHHLADDLVLFREAEHLLHDIYGLKVTVERLSGCSESESC